MCVRIRIAVHTFSHTHVYAKVLLQCGPLAEVGDVWDGGSHNAISAAFTTQSRTPKTGEAAPHWRKDARPMCMWMWRKLHTHTYNLQSSILWVGTVYTHACMYPNIRAYTWQKLQMAGSLQSSSLSFASAFCSPRRIKYELARKVGHVHMSHVTQNTRTYETRGLHVQRFTTKPGW